MQYKVLSVAFGLVDGHEFGVLFPQGTQLPATRGPFLFVAGPNKPCVRLLALDLEYLTEREKDELERTRSYKMNQGDFDDVVNVEIIDLGDLPGIYWVTVKVDFGGVVSLDVLEQDTGTRKRTRAMGGSVGLSLPSELSEWGDEDFPLPERDDGNSKALAAKGGFVFVSHASEDAYVAQEIVKQLEAFGRMCWIAPRDIPSGADFRAEIVRAIEKCALVMVLVSRNADESLHVLRELGFADSFNKPLRPVLLDHQPLGHKLRYQLQGVQWVDFDHEYKFIEAIVP